MKKALFVAVFLLTAALTVPSMSATPETKGHASEARVTQTVLIDDAAPMGDKPLAIAKDAEAETKIIEADGRGARDVPAVADESVVSEMPITAAEPITTTEPVLSAVTVTLSEPAEGDLVMIPDADDTVIETVRLLDAEKMAKTEESDGPETEAVPFEIIDLMFRENGDLMAIFAQPVDMGAVYAETIGKWFPSGDIALYKVDETNLGSAIVRVEDADGNLTICLNGYTLKTSVEFELSDAFGTMARLVDQLDNELMAQFLFSSDITYAVIPAPMDSSVEVVRNDNEVFVSIPERELTGDEFLHLVENLQFVK